MNHDDDQETVARALRALPELAPPADGWARLARRLERGAAGARPASARPAVALAIAAATLAIAALALWPALERGTRATPAPAAAPAADEAPELAARSAGLERLLGALPPARATRASTAQTAALLEDRIALVDERLSATADESLPPAATEALLRERVALLDSLVRVRAAESVGQTL